MWNFGPLQFKFFSFFCERSFLLYHNMFTSGVHTVHCLQLLHHLCELQQVGGGVLVTGEVAGGGGRGEAGGVAAQDRGVAGVAVGVVSQG